MYQFIVNYADGTTRETDDGRFVRMSDATLQEQGIVSIDRWSIALDDYVEARRVF